MTEAFACLLENRSIIGLSGADRRRFLQGLISNDINLCSTEQAIYAALLTPQGKFLHDLFIIESGDEFLIDCEAARAGDLLKRLAAYKLRAKISLRDANTEFGVWVLSSDPSRHKPGSRVTNDQDLPDRSLDPGVRRGGAIFFTDPRLPELGFRAILKKEESPSTEPRMPNAYNRRRLSLGVADGSRDMLVEKSTLAEGNFDFLNGISWTKGCYVGQELTARMHYRGLAKKRLFPVKIAGPAPVFGTPVIADGIDVGDMRSSDGDIGLTLLNIDKTGAPLFCGESRLTAIRPAWMDLEKK